MKRTSLDITFRRFRTKRRLRERKAARRLTRRTRRKIDPAAMFNSNSTIHVKEEYFQINIYSWHEVLNGNTKHSTNGTTSKNTQQKLCVYKFQG